MKVTYRGHTLEAQREKCLGGWPILYYSVFRDSDGLECINDFEDSAEKVRDKIKQLKECVDEALTQKIPWEESE